MKKTNKNNNAEKQSIKAAFSTRATKAGGFSLIVSAVVLVIVIVFNLIVSGLPAKYTQFDLTAGKTFSTGEDTASVLGGLDKAVTLYHVCKTGSEDTYIENILGDYDSFQNVNVKRIDPVVTPMFTKQYTENEVSDNTVIAVCGEKFKIISADDMYESEFDYNTYSQKTTGFCAENKITNAIVSVTNGKTHSLGLISGHGEAEIDSAFISALSDAGYTTEDVNLKSKDGIKKELSGLILLSPKADITEDEYKVISSYVKGGGKLYAATDSVKEDKFPVLVRLLRGYGINLVDGIVFEADTSNCYQSYYYVLPEKQDHEILTGLDKYYILFPVVQGFNISETLPDGIDTAQLLSTSKKAYSAVDAENKKTAEMDKNDIKSNNGFSLGAAVTVGASGGNNEDGRVVYYSCSTFMASDVDGAVSGANSTLFIKSINWLIGSEAASVSIPVKELSNESLTINEQLVTVFEIVILFALPAVFLLSGIVIIVSRRKSK